MVAAALFPEVNNTSSLLVSLWYFDIYFDIFQLCKDKRGVTSIVCICILHLSKSRLLDNDKDSIQELDIVMKASRQ